MDYKECKFYSDGKCLHEDAPKYDDGCIGYDNCEARKDDISYAQSPGTNKRG